MILARGSHMQRSSSVLSSGPLSVVASSQAADCRDKSGLSFGASSSNPCSSGSTFSSINFGCCCCCCSGKTFLENSIVKSNAAAAISASTAAKGPSTILIVSSGTSPSSSSNRGLSDASIERLGCCCDSSSSIERTCWGFLHGWTMCERCPEKGSGVWKRYSSKLD